MRERAKEHFPSVLITLLSIVQALALELLWEHFHEAPYLYEWSWIAVFAWIQIVTTFIGIMLIWVVYAANAMRFRWVPATTDSVVPFLIGVLEFTLVESLGPEHLGIWFVVMAAIVAIMNWISHVTMRRARQDADNDAFFRGRRPATLRDFYPQITWVIVLLATGLFLMIRGEPGLFAMIGLLATAGLLCGQFLVTARFWRSSVAEDR